MGENEIDHMSVSIWRFGDSWMYSISARHESGEQVALQAGTTRGTPRPLEGLDPGSAARVILYAICTS